MASSSPSPATSYDGPPDYREVGRHDLFPETSHDEIERFNYLAQFNRHLAGNVMPGVKEAFDTRVSPAFEKKEGREFKDRHEVRRALTEDNYWQVWSALRRSSMELRQQAGRWVTLRQKEALKEKAAALTDQENLELHPDTEVPRYVSAVDHHCMPGSYHTALGEGDVSGAANYDVGIFATTGGMLGRYSDGGGQAVVNWVKQNMPADFAPKRILDIGCTLGHNLVPIAAAFPDAEVIGVDVGEPVLRYGAARARSLGIKNAKFVQGNVEHLSQFADESFDWVQSTMFLHETSGKAMKTIFAETYRLLKPGGIVLHVEQPQYEDHMPLFEQAMRDWDSFYNNEPAWSTMHGLDIDSYMTAAGFDKDQLLRAGVTAVVDKDVFPDAADDDGEDYGRKAAWEVIGATK